MSYRNPAEIIAKVAAQSQSDETNATISKISFGQRSRGLLV
jgi:hypothetical protein